MYKIGRLFGLQALESKRLPWVDYAKGIAIVLVVYRHVLIGIERAGLEVHEALVVANEIVYSFRMPLFFLLSGIFVGKSLQKRSSKQFIGDKFDTIMYPYLVWGLIQLTLQILMANYTNVNKTWIYYLYLVLEPREMDQLWFLYALFNVSVLYLFFSRALGFKPLHHLFLGLALHLLSTQVKDYGLVHDALFFYIFFAVGDAVSTFILDIGNLGYLRSRKVFFAMLPFFLFSQWYWLTHPDVPLFLFTFISLLGSAFTINICFILAELEVLKAFRVVGFYSLQVYVMHVIVSAGMRAVLVKIFHVSYTPVVLFFGVFMGTLLPIVFYNLVERNFLRYLFIAPKFKRKPRGE
jgi:fucose 4-O-acetylase-like acetyltransferase